MWVRQCLGASELICVEDEFTDFFYLYAAGTSAMFLIALGKSRNAERIDRYIPQAS